MCTLASKGRKNFYNSIAVILRLLVLIPKNNWLWINPTRDYLQISINIVADWGLSMLSEQEERGRGFLLIFNLILSIFLWLVGILSEHSLANNRNRNLFLVSKSNCIRKSFTWTIVAPLSYLMPLYLWFLLIISTCLMRLSLISWIINTKVWVICQCWRLRQMTQTQRLIIHDITISKPNSVIVYCTFF